MYVPEYIMPVNHMCAGIVRDEKCEPHVCRDAGIRSVNHMCAGTVRDEKCEPHVCRDAGIRRNTRSPWTWT